MANATVSIIGNLVIDRIFIEKRYVDSSPGGTAFYAGMNLAKLSARVELISKIGADYPPGFLQILKSAGINLNTVRREKAEGSTSFRLNYKDKLVNRELHLSSKGPLILPEDIPSHIQKSKIVHLGMVAGEIDSNVLSLLDHNNHQVVGADLHFIRDVSDDKRIILGKGTPFRPFLHKIQVIKGSFEEVSAFAGTKNIRQALRKISRMGPRIVFATNGAGGSILCSEGKLFTIPAFKVKEVDPTGAGDVFLSSFLYFYGRAHEELLESAFLASAAASFVVEGKSVSRLGEESDIRGRVRLLKKEAQKRPAELRHTLRARQGSKILQ